MKNKVCTIFILFLASVVLIQTKLNAQFENKTFYNKFDNIIGYTNSGLYHGKPNTPYPNLNRENHPFFQNLNYQLASLTYRDRPYYDVQIRYDIAKDELQLLPDKGLDLLSITLFNDFIKEFSIGSHEFIKLNNLDLDGIFYEVILENPRFKLLKKYHKKAKEKLNERKDFYSVYRLRTSLFISSNGKTEKVKSKRQVLTFFPEEEKMLQELFRKNNSKENSVRAVLQEWHTNILKTERSK